MVPKQSYFSGLQFYLHGDDLRDFQIETDASGLTVGEFDCEVLMEGAGGYEVEVDPHAADTLSTLIGDAHFKEILPQLILGHLEVEFLVDFPLTTTSHTFTVSYPPQAPRD